MQVLMTVDHCKLLLTISMLLPCNEANVFCFLHNFMRFNKDIFKRIDAKCFSNHKFFSPFLSFPFSSTSITVFRYQFLSTHFSFRNIFIPIHFHPFPSIPSIHQFALNGWKMISFILFNNSINI